MFVPLQRRLSQTEFVYYSSAAAVFNTDVIAEAAAAVAAADLLARAAFVSD